MTENIFKFNLMGTSTEIPGFIINSKTFVQVRLILEALGYKISWDSKTRTVIVR